MDIAIYKACDSSNIMAADCYAASAKTCPLAGSLNRNQTMPFLSSGPCSPSLAVRDSYSYPVLPSLAPVHSPAPFYPCGTYVAYLPMLGPDYTSNARTGDACQPGPPCDARFFTKDVAAPGLHSQPHEQHLHYVAQHELQLISHYAMRAPHPQQVRSVDSDEVDEAARLRSMRHASAPDACSGIEHGACMALSEGAGRHNDDEADSGATLLQCSDPSNWHSGSTMRQRSMHLELLEMKTLEENMAADGRHFSGAALQLLMRDMLHTSMKAQPAADLEGPLSAPQ